MINSSGVLARRRNWGAKGTRISKMPVPRIPQRAKRGLFRSGDFKKSADSPFYQFEISGSVGFADLDAGAYSQSAAQSGKHEVKLG